MQRRIMMFMPLIFVLVVIRFPAGVLVYWITTNTWTIGQQFIVKRRIGPLRAATGVAGAGGGAGSRPGSIPAAVPSPSPSPTSGFGGLMARARAGRIPGPAGGEREVAADQDERQPSGYEPGRDEQAERQ